MGDENKLKTLKDLRHKYTTKPNKDVVKGAGYFIRDKNGEWIFFEELRQEAIKIVKNINHKRILNFERFYGISPVTSVLIHLAKTNPEEFKDLLDKILSAQQTHILKHFFNITPEELK